MIERDKEYYNQKISELYSIIENQEKIIRDLQEEVKGYQTMYFDKVMIVNEAIEYIESKNNGVCIVNGEEKDAYTFLLDFNKSREFIWQLLEILGDKE